MKRILFFLLVTTALATSDALAQDSYANQVLYLQNIAKNVQWPSGKTSGEFVIGVYGQSRIYPHLQGMAGRKRINGRKVKIVRFNSPQEVKDCHIVYVPKEKSDDIYKFVNSATSQSILVVTEKPGMCKLGSGVNFIQAGKKLDFELNIAALKRARLKISSDLVGYAKVF